MRIGIAGPISTESIAQFVDGKSSGLPRGYAGAPLLGTLIGALLERGHHIFSYTTSADVPLSKRVTAAGDRFKITYCPVRPRAFRFSQGHWGRAADAFRHERAALSQAMLDDAPDLVHAHWSYEFALGALESNLPNLVTCHDAPQVVLRYSPNPYRLVRYFMALRVLKQAQYLTAVSPYLKQKLESYARVPITVVPNPLPEHSAYLVASTRQYNPTHPRIAMVLNGWGARKNPQPALLAFSLLRRQIPGAQLCIMGNDYGVGGKAESWAKSKGLTNGVQFMGPQSYPELLAKLAESDLLLHPSLEETFGMSIAEAMSLGVPVVGGQSSGAVPWVIGEGGEVTDVTSPVAMKDAMLVLLSSPVAYKSYVKTARIRVQESFTADRVISAYELIYQNVMHEALVRHEERLLV